MKFGRVIYSSLSLSLTLGIEAHAITCGELARKYASHSRGKSAAIALSANLPSSGARPDPGKGAIASLAKPNPEIGFPTLSWERVESQKDPYWLSPSDLHVKVESLGRETYAIFGHGQLGRDGEIVVQSPTGRNEIRSGSTYEIGGFAAREGELWVAYNGFATPKGKNEGRPYVRIIKLTVKEDATLEQKGGFDIELPYLPKKSKMKIQALGSHPFRAQDIAIDASNEVAYVALENVGLLKVDWTSGRVLSQTRFDSGGQTMTDAPSAPLLTFGFGKKTLAPSELHSRRVMIGEDHLFIEVQASQRRFDDAFTKIVRLDKGDLSFAGIQDSLFRGTTTTQFDGRYFYARRGRHEFIQSKWNENGEKELEIVAAVIDLPDLHYDNFYWIDAKRRLHVFRVTLDDFRHVGRLEDMR